MSGRVAAALLAATLASSCSGIIYDGERPCEAGYWLTFRYDRNIKWADAFSSEVRSVRLYAFAPDGVLAWQAAERGGALASGDYGMALDLPAGDYRLLAWCGLDGDDGRNGFYVPEAVVGVTRIEQMQCSLNRQHDQAGAYCQTRLNALYYGCLDVALPAADNHNVDYRCSMSLTKDTNHIKVILQNLSGKDLDVDNFTFSISDDNGLLDCNNALLADESIEYRPWNTQTAEAGLADDSGAIANVRCAIADFTVGRMTTDHRYSMMLTVANSDGDVVIGLPLIDYALLAKDYYEQEYGHAMTDQEFLDREDEYVMTFFLDKADDWDRSCIVINSWRVVLMEWL